MKISFGGSGPAQPLTWRTAALIVAGNLVPVLGVLFLGWDAGQILILYWVENVVIGVLTLPRILTAQGPKTGREAMDGTPVGARIGLMIFFMIHYGLFCLGHGFFSAMLAAFIQSGGGDIQNPATFVSGLLSDGGFLLACAAVAVVQAVLFFREWVASGLWREAEPREEMGRPYGRLFVLHIAVIFGAFALFSLGAPAWVMLILCAGKTVLELAQARAGARSVARAG